MKRRLRSLAEHWNRSLDLLTPGMVTAWVVVGAFTVGISYADGGAAQALDVAGSFGLVWIATQFLTITLHDYRAPGTR
jgi:NhaP-type Na+/H+ or K+/H+ antiporter